jgi:23S rRNA (adenine2030-N6)-methyltransferase
VKYRHAFHAGNFADVHKHVTLLALLRLLARKDKGFLLLDTHAGRGLYDLAGVEARKAGEAAGGIDRLLGFGGAAAVPELADYLAVVRGLRRHRELRNAYPGSPLIALAALRPQDRMVLVESQAEEHAALCAALRAAARAAAAAGAEAGTDASAGTTAATPAGQGPSPTVECDDGYARLAAWLPPIERRALVLIDPPYEDGIRDMRTTERAVAECLRRLANAVIAIWYPIKHDRDCAAWRDRLIRSLPTRAGGGETPACVLELWVHPRDNRVGLNGSGMLVVNPPFGFAERAAGWLPMLHTALDPAGSGGWAVR